MNKADALLLQKRVFLSEKITDQMEEGTPFHDLIDSGSDVTDAVNVMAEWEGEYMVLMQRLSGNKNAGRSMGEEAEHAKAGGNTYLRAKYSIKTLNQSFELTGLAAMTTRGGKQSVDDLISIEADGQISAARKAVNRMMVNGDGSAKIGDVLAAGAWAESTKKLTVPDADVFSDMIGMEIIPRVLQTGAAPTNWPTDVNGNAIPALITAVDTSGDTITLTRYDGDALTQTGGTALASTMANGCAVYPFDSQGKDLWGLGIFCSESDPAYHGFVPSSTTGDTDNLGGIKRSSYDSWKGTSYVAATLGGTSTPSVRKHVIPILQRIQKRTGGSCGWLLGVTGFEVWQCLADDFARQQRTDFRVDLRYGYESIKINNLYVVVDQDADYTKLRICEPDSMFRVIPEKWHIDDTTGTYNRLTGGLGRGKNMFAIYWLTRQQLGVSRCLAFGEITGFDANL